MTEKNVVTAIHDTLFEQMAADERVVVLGEDIATRGGVFRVTQGFLDEFGERRVIDTPLAEGAIVGVAAGMALHGLIPVAEIEFADFIHPAFDQIVSEVARMRYRTNGDFGLPMVIRAPYGGGVHGALYHSQSIEAFYGHVPGIKVVVPSTPSDAAGMLRAAIADPDPVLFLEHKRTYRLIKGDVPDEPFVVPIGPADVKREGGDLTVIAYGLMLHLCLEAASRLADQEGFSVEVRAAPHRLPAAWVDPSAVAQVLINLLDNAIKYSGEARRITIDLGQRNGFVSMAVSDEGSGIEVEEQKRIFDKFYRVSDGLVHDAKGSGLGLAIVKHVVEAHLGTVSVRSRPGAGSTFTIELPTHDA